MYHLSCNQGSSTPLKNQFPCKLKLQGFNSECTLCFLIDTTWFIFNSIMVYYAGFFFTSSCQEKIPVLCIVYTFSLIWYGLTISLTFLLTVVENHSQISSSIHDGSPIWGIPMVVELVRTSAPSSKSSRKSGNQEHPNDTHKTNPRSKAKSSTTSKQLQATELRVRPSWITHSEVLKISSTCKSKNPFEQNTTIQWLKCI